MNNNSTARSIITFDLYRVSIFALVLNCSLCIHLSFHAFHANNSPHLVEFNAEYTSKEKERRTSKSRSRSIRRKTTDEFDHTYEKLTYKITTTQIVNDDDR
jgi:hypothetical protein